jgi:hypothetical protein
LLQGQKFQPQGVYGLTLVAPKAVCWIELGISEHPDEICWLIWLEFSCFDNFAVITDKLLYFGETSAVFLPDGTLVFLEAEGDKISLVQVRPDGGIVSSLTPTEGTPISLYPSLASNQIFWESGICVSFKSCERKGAWTSDLQEGKSRSLDQVKRPLVSPDGTTIAYEIPFQRTDNLRFRDSAEDQEFLSREILLPTCSGGEWLQFICLSEGVFRSNHG